MNSGKQCASSHTSSFAVARGLLETVLSKHPQCSALAICSVTPQEAGNTSLALDSFALFGTRHFVESEPNHGAIPRLKVTMYNSLSAIEMLDQALSLPFSYDVVYVENAFDTAVFSRLIKAFIKNIRNTIVISAALINLQECLDPFNLTKLAVLIIADTYIVVWGHPELLSSSMDFIAHGTMIHNLASAENFLSQLVRFHKHWNRMVLVSHLEPPTTPGADEILEAAELWQQPEPIFVLNQSEQPASNWFDKNQVIHATYFRKFCDSVLFGPNHLIDASGKWHCEAYTSMRQYTDYFMAENFARTFPGAKPKLVTCGSDIYATLRNLNFSDIEFIDEPVFLATPLEPDNWGRWIASVIPKIMFYKGRVNERKLLCRLETPWQKDIIQTLGVDCSEIVSHDPGKTYICSDLATTHYSDTDMCVSNAERTVYTEIAEMCLQQSPMDFGERIFLSRMTQSKRYPDYRVLQNEEQLICKMKEMDFAIVEPESYSFKEQVALFARAKCVVGLGGSALYTTMFCRPGTKIVTIESSDFFIRHHSRLISSSDHIYGVIFGKQDFSDPTFVHKRWTVDVESIAAALGKFL